MGGAAEPDIVEGDVALGKRFFNLRTLISFVIAFAIIAYVIYRMDIDLGTVAANIAASDKVLFIIAFVVYYLSFPVRALRWRILLGNVGYTRDSASLPALGGLWQIIMLSWFANCIIPAKIGDLVRGYMLKRTAAVSFSTTMGTVLAERLMDMVILFGLLASAGVIVFGGHVPSEVLYILLAGLALVFVIAIALVIIKLFSDKVARLLPLRFRGIYTRFAEATLLSFKNLPAIGCLTLVIWSLEAARFWAVSQSLGITDIGISAVFFLALATSLLTTLPITPAGAGVVESAVVVVLVLLSNLGIIQVIDHNLATSVAIVDRVISYYGLIAVGLVLLMITRKKWG